MNNKILIGIILLIIFNFVLHEEVLSWTEKTHENLSIYAAESSVLDKNKGDYLQSLGFENGLDEKLSWSGTLEKVKDWMAKGGNLEDESTSVLPVYGVLRSVNHFHNPLKSWSEAGLDDWVLFLHYTGESSLLWAQDEVNQSNHVGGDWSWLKVREHYYTALTGKDFTDTVVAPDKAKRDEYFAMTFRGLGHQMHLIQDAAQPDHVRNDAHPEDTLGLTYGIGFEKWAGGDPDFISSLATSPVFPDVSLDFSYNGLASITQFLDTNQYNGTNPSVSLSQGIAEYTNANFFSDDTIFAEELPIDDRHYSPYPRKESTNLQEFIDQGLLPEIIIAEDGVEDLTFYISKVNQNHGETIAHFLKPYYFTRDLIDIVDENNRAYHRWFFRDENCHADYATHLIPRAVGYSAGLLDYFFRGEMDMVPDDESGYGYVIENNTEEDMEGTFELYYDNTDDERIQLWSGSFTLGTLSSGNNRSSNITFTVPTDAKEPGKYMLVFRGRMGNEEGAVVGREVKEPSVILFLVYASEPPDVCQPAVEWKVLPYRIQGSQLKETNYELNIVKDIYGTMPVVQSAPEANKHYAITGNRVSTFQAINERVPNMNATYYRWGQNISVLSTILCKLNKRAN